MNRRRAQDLPQAPQMPEAAAPRPRRLAGPAWLALACLLLAAALAFQYSRMRDYDTAAYFENIALLRQIRQLDAHWELDAMKSKLGLNQNYDALVDPLIDLETLPRQLGTLGAHASQRAARDADEAAALASAIAALQTALTSKAALVESFKSHNAVLRNSLAFLPTAAFDAGALAPGAHDGSASARSTLVIERVLLDTLIHSDDPSEAVAQAIEARLATLEALRPGLSAAQGQRCDIFIAHVRTVLREDLLVDRLLARIDEAPTTQQLDAINALLADEQQRAVAQLQAHRRNLLLLAAALAVLLLAAGAWLARDHATIGRINAALERSNRMLEQRVAQRTDELSHSNARLRAEMDERTLLEGRLVQSEKLASVGRLAAGIAQEIDAPVTLLASHIDTLRACHDHPAQDLQAPLDESRVAIRQIDRIVRGLRDFSQIDTDQQWQWADVRRLLAGAIGTLAGELRAAGELRTEFGDVPEIECLPAQLSQVFVQLLRNAAQAIMPAHGRITLRTGGDDDWVWIEVTDTGRGIAPEIVSRIFDPFFTTRAVGEGTGLGLALCHGIVGQHGGRIDVESAPGQGSTFRVTLPVRRAVGGSAAGA